MRFRRPVSIVQLVASPASLASLASVASLAALVAVALATAPVLSGCGSESGDPHSADGVVPPAAGPDKRIREIANPNLPDHPKDKTSVAVSGATVVAVDTHDETGDGKSTGSVYVQDVGSKEPYSGIGLYAPTFVPGNLRVGPGDVLNLVGQYQETAVIASTPPVVFAPGALLPQLFRPTASFRYDFREPEPTDIDVNDLADFDKARQWLGMLVRVHNVTVQKDVTVDSLYKGRLSIGMTETEGATTDCTGPFPKIPTLVNELYATETLNITKGTTIKSITGVVTFFCNIHLAPRSAADIER